MKKLYRLLLFCCLVSTAQAQSYAWHDITPDSMATATCVSVVTSRDAGGRHALYATCNTHLIRSEDSGTTWTLLRSNTYRIAGPHDNPARLYAVADDSLLATDDGGATWRKLEAGSGFRYSFQVRRMEVSRFDENRLMLLVGDATDVLTTVDGGETFRLLRFPWESHHPSRGQAVPSAKTSDEIVMHAYDYNPSFFNPFSISTDWGASFGTFVQPPVTPGDCSYCLLTDTSGAVYINTSLRSADGGQTWEKVQVASDTNSGIIAVSSLNGIAYGERYTGDASELYITSDLGGTWRAVGAPGRPSGLSYSPHEFYRLDPIDSTLYAGGTGGIFALRKAKATQATTDQTPSSSAVRAFPNPFRETLTISVPASARATATVYDVMGKRVVVLAQRTGSADEARFEWDGRDATGSTVAPGIYIVQITSATAAPQTAMVVKL